ncbi:cryptochrome/photolyase family protein [Phytohabitans houttuyneae]|uniref:Deoxyribodipyrimidine photo-lyase n=1 Tax=Phytohabitans houttuyneae TaxID=1076126 RepID=A0A6V8KJ91_9ACTN|nr:cryptochrome/photolyase family protein [Phytohabitans houttuyneae]GFJ85253.1 deoxyribodipyrimidine photo-lyase [Phytohabitans houttuyneae]
MRRWLFADQLGPHFLDGAHQPVLLIESKAVFRRRALHRQKAHLILSAIRHRAAELGDQAVHLKAETFRDGLRQYGEVVEVCHPTSRRARDFVRAQEKVTVLPPRGFVTSHEDFAAWADGRRGAARLDDFYRHARQAHGVLMDGDEPAGGRWQVRFNDAPHQTELPPPPAPVEDDIDAEVRDDLDRWAAEGIEFIGRDGPRQFPASRAEALDRQQHFLVHRLPHFGRTGEMLAGDPWLAHSGLSTSFNMGLLEPLPAVRQAEEEFRAGHAPLSSVERFTRQVIGWRDYLWHLYWYLDAGYPAGVRTPGRSSIPSWFATLDAESVQARCLSSALAAVRDRGWAHHAVRQAVLGNYAVQRGWRPTDMVDWFERAFVDGHEWVMIGNVAGMARHAELGSVTTEAHAVSGTHISRTSDFCGGCRYDPRQRAGTGACPFTGGYWAYLHRTRERLHGNVRMTRALKQLGQIPDLPEIVAQEHDRGDRAP